MCTAQYAELGLIFTMPFVGIRIILVLRLSFAVSKTDEILSLGAGDQLFCKVQINRDFLCFQTVRRLQELFTLKIIIINFLIC